MNFPDAQGRIARWRLRLAEFTFKVECHPGIAHHAADAMSRFPHQAVPAEPMEEYIHVCTVDNRLSVLEEFPTALQEGSLDHIQEISRVREATLFEYQCRDPIARHRGSPFRPIMGIRLPWYPGTHEPSREVEVYVPPALRNERPCAIVYPVAGDGSELTVGVIRSKAARKFNTYPPIIPETTSPRLPVTRQPLRLLTRYSPVS
jgi:hypothetical protein